MSKIIPRSFRDLEWVVDITPGKGPLSVLNTLLSLVVMLLGVFSESMRPTSPQTTYVPFLTRSEDTETFFIPDIFFF